MPDESAATLAASTAIASGAVVADRSDRMRMWFPGDGGATALNGLVTNDVAALAPGAGCYAAALTAKGKVIADVRVLRQADGALVDVAPAPAPGWAAMIRKFVNPRITRYEDRSASSGTVGVYGPDAARLVGQVVPGVDLPVAPYAHVTVQRGSGTVTVLRSPDFGVEGHDLVIAREEVDTIIRQLTESGAVAATPAALEVARIEAGRPAWGAEMDENTLAQEVDMDRLEAISYSKGCYTGQETVARVHFRGHVNRLLRGLRFTGPALPSSGTPILDETGKSVGEVRSSAMSPRLGGIALALVRREVEPGATVMAGDQPASVASLPFGA